MHRSMTLRPIYFPVPMLATPTITRRFINAYVILNFFSPYVSYVTRFCPRVQCRRARHTLISPCAAVAASDDRHRSEYSSRHDNNS